MTNNQTKIEHKTNKYHNIQTQHTLFKLQVTKTRQDITNNYTTKHTTEKGNTTCTQTERIFLPHNGFIAKENKTNKQANIQQSNNNH